MKRIAVSLLMLALLPACAKESPYAEVPQPPQRIAMHGYSLMPLNEPGWVRVKGGGDGVMLSRYGDSIDETQVVMASVTEVPPVHSADELRQFFKRTMIDDVYSGRYEPQSLDFKHLTHEGATCIRSHLVSVDRYPVTFGFQSKTMRLESYQMLCLHPDAPEVGVLIGLTQQYYPGNGDPDFADKAAEVLDSLRFLKP